MKIIIYHTNIIHIGGVETFTYNLANQLKNHYDIEVIYKTCHPNQLYRFKKIVKTTKYDETAEYKCDVCILSSSWGGYPVKIKSKEYWQMIHANYKELLKTGYKYKGWEKTTKHIAVSQSVADNFYEIYKIKCEIIHNIQDEIKKVSPVLKLISATRLSGEKGYDRMIILAKELKKRKIKFIWWIFTDYNLYRINKLNIEELVYMQPTYEIFDYVVSADYGVQLSDTEGYSYFMNECLQYNTPMLATNFDSAFETMEDGVSGHILPFELFKSGTVEDWDKAIKKITTKIPKGFKYIPKANINNWIEKIGKPEKKEKYVPDPTYKVKSLAKIYYTQEGINAEAGTEFIIEDKERLEYLLGNNPSNKVYVKLL